MLLSLDFLRAPSRNKRDVIRRNGISIRVEVARVRINRRPLRADQLGPLINLKASRTKGSTRGVPSEPEIVIAPICSLAKKMRTGRPRGGQNSNAYCALLLRRKLGHNIVLRRADEYVLLAHPEVLRVIHTDPRATYQDNVINPWNTAPCCVAAPTVREPYE